MIDVYRDAGVRDAADADPGRAAARDVARRRARAGAAVGARHAVDAPARRHLRRVRLRPDARARRAASARLRSRLRAVRSRRLAGAARRPSARPARAACWPRTATPNRWRATCASTASRRASSGRRGKTRAARTTTNDALRPPLRRHRCAPPRPTPRSRRWRSYFASAPPADAAWAVFFLTGRRLKRLVPGKAIGDWAMAATGLERVAARRVLRGRRRRRGDRGAHPRSAAVDARRKT